MKKMLSQGQIMIVYGSKYLVSVIPAMEIEKVRFSVVKLETMWKDSFDFNRHYFHFALISFMCRSFERLFAALPGINSCAKEARVKITVE